MEYKYKFASAWQPLWPEATFAQVVFWPPTKGLRRRHLSTSRHVLNSGSHACAQAPAPCRSRARTERNKHMTAHDPLNGLVPELQASGANDSCKKRRQMSCSNCLLTLKGVLCTCCRPVGQAQGKKNRNKKPKAAEGAGPASVRETTADEWTSVNKGKQAPGGKPGEPDKPPRASCPLACCCPGVGNPV